MITTRVQCRAWLILVMLDGLCAADPIDPSEWRYSSPLLSTQTRALRPAEADKLLAGFCQTPVQMVPKIGPTCTTRPLDRHFADIVDSSFHPKGVVFGHFLGPENDDAAVGGWSVETHPYRWGGTLLLTKRGDAWIPIWYRSRMIIDVCEKVALPDHREILLCEDEDGGMGHALHDLYSVDLKHPRDLEHSLLARADTYKDSCLDQRQHLTDPRWFLDRDGFSIEVVTTTWSLSREPYCVGYWKRPPATVQLIFDVTSQGLTLRNQ